MMAVTQLFASTSRCTADMPKNKGSWGSSQRTFISWNLSQNKIQYKWCHFWILINVSERQFQIKFSFGHQVVGMCSFSFFKCKFVNLPGPNACWLRIITYFTINSHYNNSYITFCFYCFLKMYKVYFGKRSSKHITGACLTQKQRWVPVFQIWCSNQLRRCFFPRNWTFLSKAVERIGALTS